MTNINPDDATLLERTIIEHLGVPLGDVLQGSVDVEVCGGTATIRWAGARSIDAAEFEAIFNGVKPRAQ